MGGTFFLYEHLHPSPDSDRSGSDPVFCDQAGREERDQGAEKRGGPVSIPRHLNSRKIRCVSRAPVGIYLSKKQTRKDQG